MLFAHLLLFILSSPYRVAGLPRELVHPRGCATHVTREQALAAEAHFAKHRIARDDVAPRGTVNVPVVFHVIQKDDSLEGGNVPDSQLEQQIDVLRQDYNGTGLSFYLANATRTTDVDWFNISPSDEIGTLSMKASLRQGGRETLNVWLLGWEYFAFYGLSTLPSQYEDSPENDGVLIRFTTLPGGSDPWYNLGKTLTHEVGHWVGLYHTFQDGCDGTDFVDDTPAQESGTIGCPTTRDNCAGDGVDPIHNYMDYSDDICLTEFTSGQIERLRDQVRVYRGFDV